MSKIIPDLELSEQRIIINLALEKDGKFHGMIHPLLGKGTSTQTSPGSNSSRQAPAERRGFGVAHGDEIPWQFLALRASTAQDLFLQDP